jgi:outer membrane protein OmpU
MPFGNVQFWHDIDVKFTLSGETDNGLTFGATIDLDEVRAAGNGIPAFANPASVFISGNFGTLTMGDTDGAFDWALRDLDIIADINDSNTSHVGFNGNGLFDSDYDGQIARYDYSFGDFAFAVSAQLDDSGVGDPALAIGGKYTANLGGVDLGIGLGYAQIDTNGGAPGGDSDGIGISLDASFNNGFRAVLNYSAFNNVVVDLSGFGGFAVEPVDDHLGVGLFYTMDALSVGVNYGVWTSGIGGGWTDPSGYGLAVNYDLGGGAVVQFGYGNSTVEATFGPVGTTVSTDSFSLGVAMSF